MARRPGKAGIYGLFLAIMLVASRWAGAQQLGDLTGPWQLFVDDHLVAEKVNVERVYHPFEKYAGNPVLTADRPWEGSLPYVYGTVLPADDGSGYRMWYHCYAGEYRILYATSQDGIHWDKPNLGLVSYNGSTDNNIVIRRTSEDHTPQVIHTPWESDPQRRYKLINFDYGRTPPAHTVSGYWGAWSSDGLHWIDAPSNPVLPDPGDVGQFVWDSHAQRYLGYPKKFTDVRGYRRRCVGYSATTDFESWPASTMVLTPDLVDDRWVTGGTEHTDFYGLSAFAYESMYIGFLWIFRVTQGLATGPQDGPIFCELVSSRDGVNWVRQEGDRPPILPLGPAGSWDDGMVFTTNHPLVEGGVIKQWYGGFDVTHEGGNGHAAIGLATLRKDGFASLEAGPIAGAVTTRKLTGLSGPLRVNYTAGPEGWLKVEVLDSRGRTLPGYAAGDCDALLGDSIDEAVAWGGSAGLPLAQQPLRFRFVLKEASVYSFAVGDDVEWIDDLSGILLAFEGDSGAAATDKLAEGGVQTAVLDGQVVVDEDPVRSAFGSASAAFTGDAALRIEDTSVLGTRFTLAAMVRVDAYRLMRLFSSFGGEGSVTPRDLVFDFDPTASSMNGLRCRVNGAIVESSPQSFADNRYHHLAATYDDGEVGLYLDGELAGVGTVPAGPVLLESDLSFGADKTSGVEGESGDPLPIAQSFEEEPDGSLAGWETGNYPALDGIGSDNQLGVISTDASPTDGGVRSIRWLDLAGSGRGSVARRWAPLPHGAGLLRVAFDFKITQHTSRGLTMTVSGWDSNGQTRLNVFNTRFDSTTEDGLPLGFNYYQDSHWVSILPVSDAGQVVGHWFHFDAEADVADRTVVLSIERLDGQIGIRDYAGGFQTAQGVNPLDEDLANYQGVQVFQASPSATTELLIDNLAVQAEPGGTSSGAGQFLGSCDDVLILPRALPPEDILSLSLQGAERLFDGPVLADFDADGDVDQSDFGYFQACLTGDGVAVGPNCLDARLDDDTDADEYDLAIFLDCTTGANVALDHRCDD